MFFIKNKDNVITTITLIIASIMISVQFFNEREIDSNTRNNLNKLETNLTLTLNNLKHHQFFDLKLSEYDDELINNLKYKHPITIQSSFYIKEKINNLKIKEKITFNDMKILTKLINKTYDYDLKKNNIVIK